MTVVGHPVLSRTILYRSGWSMAVVESSVDERSRGLLTRRRSADKRSMHDYVRLVDALCPVVPVRSAVTVAATVCNAMHPNAGYVGLRSEVKARKPCHYGRFDNLPLCGAVLSAGNPGVRLGNQTWQRDNRRYLKSFWTRPRRCYAWILVPARTRYLRLSSAQLLSFVGWSAPAFGLFDLLRG